MADKWTKVVEDIVGVDHGYTLRLTSLLGGVRAQGGHKPTDQNTDLWVTHKS